MLAKYSEFLEFRSNEWSNVCANAFPVPQFSNSIFKLDVITKNRRELTIRLRFVNRK